MTLTGGLYSPGAGSRALRDVFVVAQDGVYTQDVFGPFLTQQAAEEFATAQATHPQEDGYHEYKVYHLTPKGLGDPLFSAQGERRAIHGGPDDQRDAVHRFEALDTRG